MIIISSVTKLVVHEFFHHIESPSFGHWSVSHQPGKHRRGTSDPSCRLALLHKSDRRDPAKKVCLNWALNGRIADKIFSVMIVAVLRDPEPNAAEGHS